MEVGIIGATQSGKSTLFTAITGINPGTEVGKRAVVKVPDTRLDHLTEVFKPKKKINATINFIDAPPPQGTGKKTGQAQTFLGFIKTVDALLVCAPTFLDGGFKELQDMMEILQLTDLEVVEGMISREAKSKIDPKYTGPNPELLNRLQEVLTKGGRVADLEFSDKEDSMLKSVQLFTRFPMFVVLNISEGEIGGKISEETKKAQTYLDSLKIPYLSVCATVEAQIATLPDEDREIFITEYGIKQTATTRVIQELYDLLGYQTFFTVGEDECRAWTIYKGDNAVAAAGRVHTDIARGFIRAECCTYDDFLACDNSLQKAKTAAKLRLEGKEYIVKDGEICHFRHSG